MTKSKFISDYAERYAFHILEGYTEDFAVEKMLGEVYDKVKRPTRKKYSDFCVKEINSTFTYKEHQKSLRQGMAIMAEIIYKKYLSDSNGGDSADTVSDNKVGKYSIGL